MPLKQAFNLIARLHSREATLKRLGTPTIYSPVRISPSNYFRFLEGPSSTVIRGREFILPVDTMKGQWRQLITFSEVPTQGDFTLTYDSNESDPIAFDDTAADVQTALQALTGLEDVTVTGNFTNGFTVLFVGIINPDLLVAAQGAQPLENVNGEVDITVARTSHLAWTTIIKRGDRIIDPTYGTMAIDEIIEMVDLGGEIIGYRCRCE